MLACRGSSRGVLGLWVAVLVPGLFVVGCSSQRRPTAFPPAVASPGPRVALEPGDEVEVKFFYTPQLSEIQRVRPDGKISLQLINEVYVQGKTPGELRDELMMRYRSHLEAPEIAVIVRSFHDRRVFVGGEVKAPGVIDMPGRLTALQAIMLAGGFDPRSAAVNSVIVIRHRDGVRYGCALDLEPALSGAEADVFFLEPQDIVYVPQSRIVQVGQWIDQHVQVLIPRTGFTFSTPVGKSTLGLDTTSRY